MNSTQIASFESVIENAATDLTVPAPIGIAKISSNDATTSSANIMNNVECKVLDQQIESISSTSLTDPSIVWSKKLKITYDLKLVHNSKQQILVYNEQYIDHITTQHDQIKKSMVAVDVPFEQVFVTTEVISPSFAPSHLSFVTTAPSHVTTLPSYPSSYSPSSLPSLRLSTDKPTIIPSFKPSSNIVTLEPTSSTGIIFKPTRKPSDKSNTNRKKKKKKKKKKSVKKKKKSKKKSNKTKNKAKPVGAKPPRPVVGDVNPKKSNSIGKKNRRK